MLKKTTNNCARRMLETFYLRHKICQFDLCESQRSNLNVSPNERAAPMYLLIAIGWTGFVIFFGVFGFSFKFIWRNFTNGTNNNEIAFVSIRISNHRNHSMSRMNVSHLFKSIGDIQRRKHYNWLDRFSVMQL